MGYIWEGLLVRERTARRDKDAALSAKVMDRPVNLVLIVWSRFRSMSLPAIHFSRAAFSTYLSKSCPTILCAIYVQKASAKMLTVSNYSARLSS